MKHAGILLTILANLVATGAALAQAEQGVPQLAAVDETPAIYYKLPIKEVTVFKDGHAFILHEGLAQPKRQALDVPVDKYVLDDLPSPVLGTFWCYTTSPIRKVKCVIAGQSDVDTDLEINDQLSLFRANLNKKVIIKEVVQNNKQESYQGEIVRIMSDNILLIKTSEGTKTLSLNNIQQVVFLDEITYTTSVKTQKNTLTLVMENALQKTAPKETEIGMAYVQKGIRWIPNYRVEIDGNGKAMVKLQATVINELADIENVKMNLVVGVPNFAFQDTVDPISFQTTVAQFRLNGGNAVYTSNFYNGSNLLSNAVQSQQVAFTPMDMGADLGPDIKGGNGGQEDMFLFTLNNITLKKGQRMTVPVTEFEISYEDIYTVDIGFQPPLELRNGFNPNQNMEIAKAYNNPKATHKLRLYNKSSCPLTTAPATIIKNGVVLSQGTMKYTAIGSKGDLDLAMAVNINIKANDELAGIKEKAAEWQTYSRDGLHRMETYVFNQVNMAGKFTIYNFSDKPIKLQIKKTVLGNMDSADSEGQIKQLGQIYDSQVSEEGLPFWWSWCGWPWWWYHFNNIGMASWELELKPQSETNLNYNWHYYWE